MTDPKPRALFSEGTLGLEVKLTRIPKRRGGENWYLLSACSVPCPGLGVYVSQLILTTSGERRGSGDTQTRPPTIPRRRILSSRNCMCRDGQGRWCPALGGRGSFRADRDCVRGRWGSEKEWVREERGVGGQTDGCFCSTAQRPSLQTGQQWVLRDSKD